MTKIVVFVGSLQKESLNKKLAKNLEKLTPKDVVFEYIDISVLPHFNQDLEMTFPKEAQRIKDAVEAADGVLFVTPEYNRSIPGVLKNAIDWVSRPYGYNSFNQKPTGIVGASTGQIGTAVAQADLRHIGGFLNIKLMGQPELYLNNGTDKFDEHGEIVLQWRDRLQNYIDAFVMWIEKEKQA